MTSETPTIIYELFPDFFKLHGEWCDFFFSDEMEELICKTLEQLQSNKKAFYPSSENIFRCFYKTRYEEIKVVLIGQEPYYNAATGLCFEVKKGNLLNSSLQNIYKELKTEGFYPTEDGCLLSWANQGVLLLNTALTMSSGDPGSHLEIWGPFTEKIFKKLSEKEFIVWIILGEQAAGWKNLISDHHIILEASHPSHCLFLGSNIFKNVNSELYKKGIDKIVW